MKEIAETETRNKPYERDEDNEDTHDVLLRHSDPLHVLAFKKVVNTGIVQYAYERTIKALNYAP